MQINLFANGKKYFKWYSKIATPQLKQQSIIPAALYAMITKRCQHKTSWQLEKLSAQTMAKLSQNQEKEKTII